MVSRLAVIIRNEAISCRSDYANFMLCQEIASEASQ